jgi:hypothetical protein
MSTFGFSRSPSLFLCLSGKESRFVFCLGKYRLLTPQLGRLDGSGIAKQRSLLGRTKDCSLGSTENCLELQNENDFLKNNEDLFDLEDKDERS